MIKLLSANIRFSNVDLQIATYFSKFFKNPMVCKIIKDEKGIFSSSINGKRRVFSMVFPPYSQVFIDRNKVTLISRDQIVVYDSHDLLKRIKETEDDDTVANEILQILRK